MARDRSSHGWIVETTHGQRLTAFGCTPADAIQYVMEVLPDGDLPETVERCEELDVFSPGPASIEVMITEMGYAYVCPGCGIRVDDELFNYRTGKTMKPIYRDEKQMVFCSPECEVRHDREVQLSLN